ncbi:MAG: UPF0179 family protein [Thermoplasmata archaeon]|nr:UPF0179 family protein [Thermoplasmata archaeon]
MATSPHLTAIGTYLAKEGLEFVYLGPSKECRSCPIKSVCLALKQGFHYRITAVRDKEHNCAVHEGGKVKIVEVEEVPFKVAVPSKSALKGATIVFYRERCEGCPPGLCNPPGLKEGTKLVIVDVGEKLECGDLTVVTVRSPEH